MPDEDTKRPESHRIRPGTAEGRKVWAEVYPGGDMMIELGGIDSDAELYLSPGEPEALLEVLEQLVGQNDTDGSPDAWHYEVIGESGESYWLFTTAIEDIEEQYGKIQRLEIGDRVPLYDGETVAMILNEQSTSAAEVLAAETGRPVEEFEPPADVEMPDPDDLETVEGDPDE